MRTSTTDLFTEVLSRFQGSDEEYIEDLCNLCVGDGGAKSAMLKLKELIHMKAIKELSTMASLPPDDATKIAGSKAKYQLLCTIHNYLDKITKEE